MLLYDLGSLVLIGIGHIYLFSLLLGKSDTSLRFMLVLGVLFTALLSILLAVTGYSELNILLLFAFLLGLGWLQKKHTLIQIIYFVLMSLVLLTVVKDGLMKIVYALYMESPFNYYVWTNSMLYFYVILALVILLFLARNFITLAGDYLVRSKIYVWSYVVLIVCTLFLLIINYPKLSWLQQLNVLYGAQLYMLMLVIALVLLLIMTVVTYKSKELLIEQHEQFRQQQLLAYVEKLEFLHDELATFRHDYANLLLSFEEAIRTNDVKHVKQIYEQTIAPTAQLINHQQLELTKLSRIMQPELKSLLSMKVLFAQKKALTVHLDIPQPLGSHAMPMDELIRVVSVLVDNAIEEAQQSEERMLQIALFNIEACRYIIVKNSRHTAAIDLEALYQKNVSMKGQGRGLGLFSVQRLIQKNPNATLMTKVDNAYFVQELIIKDRS